MVTIQVNWTTDYDDWGTYLKHIRLPQLEVANFLGVSDVTMSNIVKDMTTKKGLGASEKTQDRWKRAVAYVKLRAGEMEESK